MIAPLTLAVLIATAPPVCCVVPPLRIADAELREIWEGGRTFEDFLGTATRRRPLWDRLVREGSVPGDLVARARAVGGTWRILAVAEDWCGDSAYNLPYVAKLAAAVPGVDLRIVSAASGRSVLESHRTPDGRAATPTFVLLDGSWGEAGCFVERPGQLMAWYMANHESLESGPLHEHIVSWYETDAGRGAITEIVEMLEAAAAGAPRCPRGDA